MCESLRGRGTLRETGEGQTAVAAVCTVRSSLRFRLETRATITADRTWLLVLFYFQMLFQNTFVIILYISEAHITCHIILELILNKIIMFFCVPNTSLVSTK